MCHFSPMCSQLHVNNQYVDVRIIRVCFLWPRGRLPKWVSLLRFASISLVMELDWLEFLQGNMLPVSLSFYESSSITKSLTTFTLVHRAVTLKTISFACVSDSRLWVFASTRFTEQHSTRRTISASLSKTLNSFNTYACGRIVVGKLSAVSLAIILESLFFGREYDFLQHMFAEG